jgi:hypothetical protein
MTEPARKKCDARRGQPGGRFFISAEEGRWPSIHAGQVRILVASTAKDLLVKQECSATAPEE